MPVPPWNDPPSQQALSQLRKLREQSPDPAVSPVVRLAMLALEGDWGDLRPDLRPFLEQRTAELYYLSRRNREAALRQLGEVPPLNQRDPKEAAVQALLHLHEQMSMRDNYPPPRPGLSPSLG